MSVTATPDTSSDPDLTRLRSRVVGPVTTPTDAAYDEVRACWNLAFDVHPAVVVEPEDADDVMSVLDFAARNGVGVGVQATGHGLTLGADGAVLVSTRRMDGVEVDPGARTARIAAGATWGPVLAEAQLHGLAPLAGSAPHVGAVGYTLGGGMGWLARKHGLSADKVLAIEVVTPDARLRRVTVDSDPELFWALRGGGAGSLGIVTAIEIELVEVTEVYAGNLLYPAHLAPEVFSRFAAWVEDVPDELTSAVVVMNFPPFEEVPEPIRGQSFVLLRGCWCGPTAEGAALVDEWRTWQEPALDLFGPMPFAEMAAISQDPVDPVPATVSTDSLAALGPEVAEILIEHTLPRQGPPELIFTEVRHGGGALALPGGGAESSGQPGLGDTGSPGPGRQRGAGHTRLGDIPFITHSVGICDPSAPERLSSHLTRLRTALAPHRTEHAYLNFLDGEDRAERTREAFTPAELERLRAVKAAVDPTNLLRYGVPL